MLGDSIAAANSSISGPVSADERSRILGYFADGPGYGSTGFRPDISATTADRLLADNGMGRSNYGGGTQYASVAGVLRSGRMTDAGDWGVNPESIESLRQPDGTYRVEISGTDVGIGDADVASMRAENLAQIGRASCRERV